MPHTAIQTDGSIVYRTKLMPLTRAASFARCLDGNTRFTSVMLEKPAKAKADKFFVTFRPANPERQTALYQTEWDKREARAENEGGDYIFWKDPDGRFWWVFNPLSGETYELTPFSCSCPDYQFRCNKAGLHCKHMHALQLQADAGTLGKTDKTTPAPANETARQKLARLAAVDFD